jgi:dTDP-4-amino-4,6-dideoxygalactose transaminase
MAAIGACEIGPGDEVIVSPYTMSASATAILVFNAIPVFADIEEYTFNLNPKSIEKCITKRTKAIMVPNIFGHAADYRTINRIARNRDLFVIEDNAQSPLAKYHGRYAGTIGDIGVFSLNYHKHIHTGEGGVCLTNNKVLAERMQLIRNHAEAIVEDKRVTNLVNMIGYNFRLGEIEAAIGIEQLKKLKKLVISRIKIAGKLSSLLMDIDLLELPHVTKGTSHVYYLLPLKYKGTEIPISVVEKALNAEGVPISRGYVKPLYLQPLYQDKTVYGNMGCPFSCSFYEGSVSYKKGICPTAERMNEKELLIMEICKYDLSESDICSISEAFHKVFNNLEQLKNG